MSVRLKYFTDTKVAQKGDYDLAKQLDHLPMLLL